MRTIAPGRAALADLRSKITAADYAIMVRVSAASSPGLDRAMPGLDRAAGSGCCSPATAGTSPRGGTLLPPGPQRRPAGHQDDRRQSAAGPGAADRRRRMGTLARSRVYRTWTAPELTIETRDGSPVQLSTDGEVMTADATVTLRKRRDPLLVYRPES
jgi:hypothetical protein